MEMDKSILEKIPFIDAKNLNGRSINLMPFWDGVDFHMWFPFRNSENEDDLLLSKNNVVSVQYYFGKEKKHPSDLYIPFVDLMFQRASYPDIFKDITAICNDISNFGVSLAKIQHTFNTSEQINRNLISEFVTTEIEYILTNARSVFDHLYSIIKWFWDHFVYSNGEKIKTSEFPKKLSSFLLNDGAPTTSEELVRKYRISEPLADAFASHSLLFSKLRKYRDSIIHKGNSVEFIFTTERGFCVRYDQMPFADFYRTIDRSSFMENEFLVSLKPWLAYVVHGAIEACNNFVSAFFLAYPPPPPLAPDFNIYFCDNSQGCFLDVLNVKDDGLPWWTIFSISSDNKTDK